MEAGSMANAPRSSDRVFFRSRIALAVGFGGLLTIMALAGIDALNVLHQFRRSDEQIRRRYLSQNHTLNDIRSDVYVSGTYVRDYLLEPDAKSAEVYRTALQDVRKPIADGRVAIGLAPPRLRSTPRLLSRWVAVAH